MFGETTVELYLFKTGINELHAFRNILCLLSA